METASEIYLASVRDWLPFVFLTGLAIVTFVIRDRWAELWTYINSGRGSLMVAGAEAWRPFLRVVVPYWVWMLAFGLPAVLVDGALGVP